jgi:hypothetical protein
MFLDTLEVLIQKSPNDCPFIALGDFNIDVLNHNNHENNKSQSIDFMNKLKLKSQFKISQQKLDHNSTIYGKCAKE